MISALDVSTSALAAQRVRLNAISSNLANINTTRDAQGAVAPYRPRFVVFQTDDATATESGGVGVRVAEVVTDQSEPLFRYEPGHPDADARGYVAYPNVDMTTEFVDAMEATRAYEANIGVMEITKDLARQSLRIVA